MTGYQIQGSDRNNAFSDDRKQVFQTLEEARGWADEIWNTVLECEKDMDYLEENEKSKKENFIIAYYEKGICCKEYPLFVE